MSFTRRRSDRASVNRRACAFAPEILEQRQMLSGVPGYLAPWVPSDLSVYNPITNQRELVNPQSLINPSNPNSPLLGNSGKIVTGTDRAGDRWTITVHGPGKVIVTDTTPNDGVLGDDINTIQLVGTNPKTTYVTGNVITSPTTLTQGTILFNELIATSGVKSIKLNGFTLTANVSPAVTSPTGVFLYGGVGTLSFQDIQAPIDTSVSSTPYQIVIGEPNTPLKVKPSIYLGNINNQVFDSTSTTIPTGPQTSPTVQFVINGVIRTFDIVSATQGTVPAAFQFEFPTVGTTGRTSVQATAIDNLTVHGSAKNFTVSKASQPFSSAGSGIDYLHNATFGGNADAVGIDVNGTIGTLIFNRGLGDPTGTFTAEQATTGLLLPQTSYGIPQGTTGYPASNLLGGTVSAKHIHKLVVQPANVLVQTPSNPYYAQLYAQGYPTYVTSPGYSLTNASIVVSGSIDQAAIFGTQLFSEVKTGFDYPSYVAGLEGTRAPSKIHLKQKGDLITSVISATFRPANNNYNSGGTAGPGTIVGGISGTSYNTAALTALNNKGAGVFARTKKP